MDKVTPIKSSVWTFEDYTERRCMLSDVGHERYDPGYARRVAQRHTGVAIEALVDIAAQRSDLPAATKAAQVLLERGWGKAEITNINVTPPQQDWPEWLSSRRLAYQEGAVYAPDIEDIESRQLPPPEDQARARARSIAVGRSQGVAHGLPDDDPQGPEDPVH